MPVGVGDVVVDDEGVMVPLTKLTVKEMRVEAVASGFMDADEAHNARRVELLPFIKVRCTSGGSNSGSSRLRDSFTFAGCVWERSAHAVGAAVSSCFVCSSTGCYG